MSDYFSGAFAGRSQRPVTAQLPELQPDPTSQILNRLPVIPGKRSLAEFQAQHQHNQALSFYLRNVKPRNYNSPSILGYPVSRQTNSEITPRFRNYTNLVPNQNQNLISNLQNTQITPDFRTYSNLAPAEFPNSRTPDLCNYPNLVPSKYENTTNNTPGVFNYPDSVPGQNQNKMNSLQPGITQTTPSFHSYSNLVPTEFPNSRSNTGINPDLFNCPNLVPSKYEKTTDNTPGLFNYTDSAPDENNDEITEKLNALEKHLLGDDDDDGDDTNSVVTNNEWTETINRILGPPQHPPHSLSLSPSSSCSSCCSSAPPSLSPKQTLFEAAAALSENKPDLAREILTRLTQSACVKGTPEQRLVKYLSDALRARVAPTPLTGLNTEDHALFTQMLFEANPCFKLGFMAANLAILDATSSSKYDATSAQKLHVVDFEIGRGGHYVHLIHALAAKNQKTPLKITAITGHRANTVTVEKISRIGDGLKSLATKVGVSLAFEVSSMKRVADLSLESLGIERGEKLAVNLSFALCKLHDESVTTDNPRDELLRRVKNMSPEIVTVVEQEMNTNTAPFLARVNETCGYYSALFESLDSIIARDNPDRVRIEEGLGRVLTNSVSCEGRERLERCEVFGKWRARMGMAGFRPRPMARPVVESIVARLGIGTRGNSGFTVKEESGGILFGWMGRTLTVASAWH